MRLRRVRKKLIKVTETTAGGHPAHACLYTEGAGQAERTRMEEGAGSKTTRTECENWDPDRSEQEEVVAVGPQADRRG